MLVLEDGGGDVSSELSDNKNIDELIEYMEVEPVVKIIQKRDAERKKKEQNE